METWSEGASTFRSSDSHNSHNSHNMVFMVRLKLLRRKRGNYIYMTLLLFDILNLLRKIQCSKSLYKYIQ